MEPWTIRKIWKCNQTKRPTFWPCSRFPPFFTMWHTENDKRMPLVFILNVDCIRFFFLFLLLFLSLGLCTLYGTKTPPNDYYFLFAAWQRNERIIQIFCIFFFFIFSSVFFSLRSIVCNWRSNKKSIFLWMELDKSEQKRLVFFFFFLKPHKTHSFLLVENGVWAFLIGIFAHFWISFHKIMLKLKWNLPRKKNYQRILDFARNCLHVAILRWIFHSHYSKHLPRHCALFRLEFPSK